MLNLLDSSQDIHPALNDGGMHATVANISAPSVIASENEQRSRNLFLVRECRGMKNPFAKKGTGY